MDVSRLARTAARFLQVLTMGGLTALSCAHAQPVAAEALPAGAVLQELEAFGQFGRILYVAAHPDDENTRLLSYFAKGRGFRTGYLSLTRGDGGQNLIGSELRDNLGVIRTQELLAARRIDGAVQFFSRANDFGFSKHPDETFRIWDRQAVLSDVVRTIRIFRPDVMVTRFSVEPGITHGHHTASAILAGEAFRLAADPAAFPEQLIRDGLSVWQVKRIAWNSFPAAMRGGNRGRDGGDALTLQLDTGGYNPLLGESFGEIAARSRTQHKSQGFGSVAIRGSALDYFRIVAGEPATRDLFDGVETGWKRIPGGEEIGIGAKAVASGFDPRNPSASLPGLLALRAKLAALPVGREAVRLADKRQQLDGVIFACLGIFVETAVPSAEVAPGEKLDLRLRALIRNRPAGLAVRWTTVRFPASGETLTPSVDLAVNQPAEQAASAEVPKDTPVSTPYWLREPGTEGLFTVADPNSIGRPENPPVFPVEHSFEIAGQTLVLADRAVQVIDDPIRGEIRRPLQVVPPITLSFTQELELFAPGATRTLSLDVTATRGPAAGNVRVEAPQGWTSAPASRAFRLDDAGTRGRFVFSVTAPKSASIGKLGASAEIDGAHCQTTRIDIRYDHIPAQLLQPAAQAKVVSVELAILGKTVGYLPGAGDLVAESIGRMGYTVTILGSADLTVDRLKTFDAVVLGVRALNTRSDIGASMPALFAYAEQGGTVICQYNTTHDLQTEALAPFPLTLSRDRVVDENAPVTLIVPDHPAVTTPNRLTDADFAGWVQERGLYFPSAWDDRFTPILSCADEGEPARKGALLVAKHGRGYFVYTGLSFFRELPAGVPGAYRLFANLISLGK